MTEGQAHIADRLRRPTGLGTSAAKLADLFGLGSDESASDSKPYELRTSSGITVPRLHCPEPVRIDEPLGAEVNERVVAWVAEIGIFAGQLDRVRAANYGRYAMLIHPDTDDPDRLLLAAQCMAALFAVDDHYCDDERDGSDPGELGQRLALAQAAIDPVYITDERYAAQLAAAMKADPVRVGLSAYMDRVAEYATPAQRDRVRAVIVAMFLAMDWEAGWRIRGGLPPAWEYLATRQPNSFAPCMTLIDIVGGYAVPGELYSLPAVRRATALAANASIILNDLYSLDKEVEPEIGDGGLPDVIAAEDGCSLQEAVNRTAVIHDDCVRAFEAARRRLIATNPSPPLWRYLAGLYAWLGGSREWHAKSGRYNSSTDR